MRQKRLENTFFLGGDCSVPEDILPLIPWCHPVLCHDAEAVETVAKELNELAMNFPHGCDRVLSKAVARAPTRTTVFCNC